MVIIFAIDRIKICADNENACLGYKADVSRYL